MHQMYKSVFFKKTLMLLLWIITIGICIYIGSFQEEENTTSTQKAVAPNQTSNETTVLFEGLTTEARDLPPLPSEDDWRKIVESEDIFRNKFEDDVRRFGDIAKRYHTHEEYRHFYLQITEADLNLDGKPEKIVGFDGGGSYGVEKYEIIENDKIIATITSPSTGRGSIIKPGPTGNGFSIIWYTPDMFPGGYCCPIAQIVTQFVFKDGTFHISDEKVEKIVL